MQVLANAKINLGLNIRSKREDGYHNIESCFLPVPISDRITVQQSVQNEFSSSGIAIPDDGKSNLCLRALELMQMNYDIGQYHIHLEKIIPIGAGLGGGSSDAVAVLKAINQINSLNCSNQELKELALEIGSDCPFFVENKPALVKGRGELLETLNDFSIDCNAILIYPALHVSTKEAYQNIVLSPNAPSLKKIISWPLLDWKGKLHNGFENSVFSIYPKLDNIKKSLYKAGAFYASMSGSGSAIFGLFENDIPEISLADNYSVFRFKLSI